MRRTRILPFARNLQHPPSRPNWQRTLALEALEDKALLSLGAALATAAGPQAATEYRSVANLPAAALPAIVSVLPQQAELTASNPTAEDFFGDAVAVHGNTVVVGTPYGNNSLGSAYVFTRPASGWTNMTEVARLTPSAGTAWDYFGISVGIDGNTIVVGADAATTAAGKSGAAYLFSEPASGWTNMTPTAVLTSSDATAYAQFGISVAVSGHARWSSAPTA